CGLCSSHATATSTIHPLSLHDALPIFEISQAAQVVCHPGMGEDSHPFDEIIELLPGQGLHDRGDLSQFAVGAIFGIEDLHIELRSEEHTSELQSRENLVCRLLLEKKNK